MAFERVKKFFRDNFLRQPSLSAATPRTLPGGRLTSDTQFQSLTPGLSVLAPFSADDYWRENNLDAQTLSKISPKKLLELLVDLSPDVSKALWDWILFMNPGHEIKAYKLGSRDKKNKTIDTKAQQAIDSFKASLHGPFTSDKIIPFDVTIATLLIGMFTRGALFCELVLDEAGRLPIDIATPDPVTVSRKRVTDEQKERGVVWQLGQWQLGQFVPLDRPTVFYVPIHPFPGNAHGRSLAAPALFSTLFLLGTLHDLRRVVAQQGYPRLDIEVNFELLKERMPPDLTADPDGQEAWNAKIIEQVQTFYSMLEPDDAFVHSDAVKLNKPVGTLSDSQFMSSIDGLINAIERQVVRALKSMPLLFGINEAVAETHANRQWEVHVAGIKAMQHLLETTFEKLFTLALQCQGIVADVEVKFSELRAAELLRDAQVKYLEDQIAAFRVKMGWISNDEAAEARVGHKAAGPMLELPTTGAGNTTTVNADPGSSRTQSIMDFMPRVELKENVA